MKIAVVGLWHLGTVTAGCLANAGNHVIAFDPDEKIITMLKEGRTPVYEPGLNDLLNNNRTAGRIIFTNNLNDLAEAEIVWVAIDTPVDEDDHADVAYVFNQISSTFKYVQNNCLIIISSQIPAGSTRKLQSIADENFFDKKLTLAYSPENLRLGKAIDVFSNPDRIVVGLNNNSDKQRIIKLLEPFSTNIIWMSVESAEMTKHAINAFLASSVIFINEIATLCEQIGANAREVEMGLKSEDRIGAKAYLRPGNALAGGTLARDVNYLIELSKQNSVQNLLFPTLIESNNVHKQWACRKIKEILQDLNNKNITVLGLAYKTNTNTLRRSSAIEACRWLKQQGANVKAYDPQIKILPDEFTSFINLQNTVFEAVQDTDAIIISTECPEFFELTSEHLLTNTKSPCVVDAAGFLKKSLGVDKKINYFSVGESQ